MKHLKILLSFLLYFSLSLNGFSQKKSDCKFDVDKTDPKTGATIEKIKTKLTGTDNFFVIISRNDTAYTLTLNFWISGALKEQINPKDPATIKLSGWKNLVLHSTQTVKPVMHYDDQTWSEYAPEYPIRAADLKKLIDTKPLDLHLNVGIEPFSRDFNEKDNDKIIEIIKCIMK